MKTILRELVEHAPFTAIGAVTGIITMVVLVLTKTTQIVSEGLFHITHPAHVLLSCLVTTAMYRKYGKGGAIKAFIIGYVGSIGPATISDIFIPYLGGMLLGIKMELHLPFIETEPMHFIGLPVWFVINAAAVVGILIGYLKPQTRFPHATHVLLSTWASLFSFTAYGVANWMPLLFPIFIFLFISVWLPCCFSDIVFPLMWGVKEHTD